MTEIDEQVREALQQIAGESRPTDLLTPVLRRRVRERRRRLVLAAAAAAVVVVTAGLVVPRGASSADPLPAQQPPAVFRLPTTTTAHAGAALLAVTFGAAHSSREPAPVYLVSRKTGAPVALQEPGQRQPGLDHQRLSADGRRVLQLGGHSLSSVAVLTNLVTGQQRRFPALEVTYAELSPDGATIAVLDGTLTTIDVRSGHRRVLRRLATSPGLGAQAGFTPDGRLIAVKDGPDTVVVARDGRLRVRLPGISPVNGSLSWTRDGRGLLGYHGASNSFRIVPLGGGRGTDVRPPTNTRRCLGWSGDRIVWLTGDPGSQRLVTTDAAGRDRQPWMRFAVGTASVDDVTWSRALGG